MEAGNGIAGLIDLGFSELEARAYSVLLQRSPMTGYKVAQALGKPATNTYKALESLQKKGAVIVEDGENRLCRAIPSAELLSTLERNFLQRKTEAARALAKLETPSSDERIYTLHTAEQVFERCRSMLDRCKEIAHLDIFPEPLKHLQRDIEKASRRCKVTVLVYKPVRLPRGIAFLNPNGRKIMARWPGQWINIVIDGSEHLIALLTGDSKAVHQAVWSESAYLSWIYHCGLASETILAALAALMESKASAKEIARTYRKYRPFMALEAPGYQTLMRRFREVPSRRRKS